MHPRIPFRAILAGSALLSLVVACSSDGTSPPPAAQGVQVTVSTTGFHLDPDGYTLRLGAREGAVEVNGTVVFDQLEPGNHTVELTGLQENCSADGGGSVHLVLNEGETKSVTFEISCAYDMSGAALPVVACPEMAPAVAHGLPGEEISLGALPAGLTAPLFARVSWAGGDEAGLAFVDPGSATMVAPLHPGALRAGGAVEIRISDEAGSCAPFAFTVDALPPAPGELAAVVELWQELLEAQAAMAGVTVSDLTSKPIEDFPLPLRGLHIAQGLLDHPETANSLRSLADGTAPELQDIDGDYLDALLASVGMRGALERRIAAALEGVALLNPPAGGAPAGDLAIREIRSAIDCLTGIEDEVALETCMTLARKNILGPIEEAYVNDLRNSLTFVQTLPITDKGFKQLFQALSGLVLLETHFADYLAGVLPTEFVSIEVQPNPAFFYEDTPGPGSWTPAQVRAVSKGWESDKLLQEIMVRSVKVSGSYKEFLEGSRAGAAAVLGLEATEAAWNTFLSNLISQVYSAILKRVFGLSDGPNVPPETFGPIPLRSESYVTSRMVLDEFVVRTGHDALDPRKPGTDYLHVITAQGRFGGVNIQTDPLIPIEVRQMELEFWDFIPSPVTEVFVSPGDTVPLELVVRNTKFPRMVELEELLPQWGTAEMTLGGDPEAEGTAVHTVRYIAPADLKDLPGELTAVSTSNTGAIQYAGGFRRAKLTIRPYQVEITTEPPCLEPGDSLQIDVQVKGLPEDELVWSTDAGTVTQSGLFVAPGNASDVTVTVEWSEDPRVKDSILLQIGSCSCQATLELNGSAPTTERLTFYLTESLTSVREVAWGGFLSSASFTFGGTPGAEEPVTVGATGTFPAVGGGYVDGMGNFGNLGTQAVPPMTPLQGNVLENEGGNTLAGSVAGWVQLQDLENPVAFSLTYRIVADPAFSSATERRCYVEQ